MKVNLNIKNIALYCASGLLAVCAFPKFNLFFLIWVAFVPIAFAMMRANTITAFLGGFLSGFVFNAFGLYWLVPMLHFNTDSYVQAIIASSALWVYLALYWGLWSFGLQKYISFQECKYSDWLIVIFGACLWVFLEYVRTYFLTGFPWMLIGYSQFEFSKIIQISEFTGVYGISFIIIFCNLCFFFWLSRKEKLFLYVGVLIIFLVTIFGVFRIHKFKLLGEKRHNVSIVQPNIDQYKKWDNEYRQEILSNLKKQALEVNKLAPELVLWPESVLPGLLPGDWQVYSHAKDLAINSNSFNIMGSLYVQDYDNCFNVVLGFNSLGECKFIHKKNHLVPFGEFIPFRKFIARFFGVLNQMGDIERGHDISIFNKGELFIGPTICSENFFPDIARKIVLNGAKVLTNHTNDAWFFDTAAPYQHFMMNVFRAVENRRFMLVSANTGVSGIIEASGAVVDKTVVSKEELLSGTFSQNEFETFYTRCGDVFVGACIVILPVLVVFSYRKRRNNSRQL
ncbi:MAG: apolipoprotein N-acyltransferase [Endomicrobium sp.]|jgi:apolipoprotein N-acyltransferase|nr:apolipoprotein N-acyltransferase [Endomicrobium sp.]